MDDAFDFETGFLADSNEIDLKTHIWLFKKQREVARRMKIYRGEVEGHQPGYPKGSSAASATVISIQDDDWSLIEYSEEDDSAIGDYIRKNITTCVSCTQIPTMSTIVPSATVFTNHNQTQTLTLIPSSGTDSERARWRRERSNLAWLTRD